MVDAAATVGARVAAGLGVGATAGTCVDVGIGGGVADGAHAAIVSVTMARVSSAKRIVKRSFDYGFRSKLTSVRF